MRHLPVHAALLSVVLALGACRVDQGDHVAAEQSALAMTSGANLSYVSEFVFSAPSLIDVPAQQAHDTLVGVIRLALGIIFFQAECVTVDSDGPSDVALIFDRCPVEGAGGPGGDPAAAPVVDGEIRADIEFDTADCPPPSLQQCPVAIRYRIELIQFRFGPSLLDGAVDLHVPVALTEARSSAGSFTYEHDGGASLTFAANATWIRDGDSCVDVSWDAQLTLDEEAMTAIGTDVETVAATARDVKRCDRQCPDAGTLDIAYNHGEILRITYDGSSTAQVVGPRGVTFELDLPCAAGPTTGFPGSP